MHFPAKCCEVFTSTVLEDKINSARVMNLSFFLQKGESLTDRVDAKTKVRDTLPWNQDGLFETNKIGQQRQSVAHNENRRSGSGEGTLAI